jgi:hypothetical protein
VALLPELRYEVAAHAEGFTIRREVRQALEAKVEELPQIVRVLEDEVYECLLLLDDFQEETPRELIREELHLVDECLHQSVVLHFQSLHVLRELGYL